MLRISCWMRLLRLDTPRLFGRSPAPPNTRIQILDTLQGLGRCSALPKSLKYSVPEPRSHQKMQTRQDSGQNNAACLRGPLAAPPKRRSAGLSATASLAARQLQSLRHSAGLSATAPLAAPQRCERHSQRCSATRSAAAPQRRSAAAQFAAPQRH